LIIMTQSEMTFSFIIPVLNGERFIKGCIEHIILEKKAQDEIILIDNGSVDRTLEIAASFREVKVLRYPGMTIAALRNYGAKEAKGGVLAFIDVDCIVCQGWRDAAQARLEMDGVQATGAKYDIPDNAVWIEKAWYSQRTKTGGPINYLNSGNLIIKTDIFRAIAGFDESLETDEDYDLGIRLKKAGYLMVEDPRIRAIHLGNHKSLRAFVNKEKWHATSMLSSLKRHEIDKVTLMTALFILMNLSALAGLFFVLTLSRELILIAVALLSVPVVTSIYRVVTYRCYPYLLHLVILYFLFFIVRSWTIIRIIIRK
jgi:glycosyltransferase involved in cell wall biosynthesis